MVSKEVLKYLNFATNKLAKDSKAPHSNVSISFAIKSEKGGSYATLQDSLKYKKSNSVMVTSGDELKLTNIINISETKLKVLDSFVGQLIDKDVILQETGMSDSKYLCGTAAFVFNVVVHEVTHAVNFHVYSEGFERMINYYLDAQSSGFNVLSESYSADFPRNTVAMRYSKAPSVFFLYPYNNFVRGWAEVEAGAAGFTAAVFYVGMVLRCILYLLSVHEDDQYSTFYGLYKKSNFDVDSDPLPALFGELVYPILSGSMRPEDLDNMLSSDDLWVKIYDSVYNLLVKGVQSKRLMEGALGLNEVFRMINDNFEYNYGFHKVMRYMFGLIDDDLQDKFLNMLFHAVAGEVAYSLKHELLNDKSRLMGVLKKYMGVSIDKSFADIIRDLKPVLYEAYASVIIYSLGDIALSADYIVGWSVAMTPYLIKLYERIRDFDSLVYGMRDVSGLNFISQILRKPEGADYYTNTMNILLRGLSAIIQVSGGPEDYAEHLVLSKNVKHINIGSLKSSLSQMISYSVSLGVYDMLDTANDGNKGFRQNLQNLHYTVSSKYSGASDVKNDKFGEVLTLYNSGSLNVFAGAGTPFLLVKMFAILSTNWAYNIAEDIKSSSTDAVKIFSADSLGEALFNTIEKLSEDLDAIRDKFVSLVKQNVYSSTNKIINIASFEHIVPYLYPTSVSDFSVFYNAVGCQMRAYEYGAKLHKMITDHEELKRLVKEKNDLINKISGDTDGSKKKDTQQEQDILSQIEQMQNNIDTVLNKIVYEFIKTITTKNIWELWPEVHPEEQEEEEEKPQEPNKKEVPMTKKQLVEVLLKILHQYQDDLYKFFMESYGVLQKQTLEVYEQYASISLPQDPKEINRLLEKLNVFSTIINQIPTAKEFLKNTNEAMNAVENLAQKYPEYARDIEDIAVYIHASASSSGHFSKRIKVGSKSSQRRKRRVRV